MPQFRTLYFIIWGIYFPNGFSLSKFTGHRQGRGKFSNVMALHGTLISKLPHSQYIVILSAKHEHSRQSSCYFLLLKIIFISVKTRKIVSINQLIALIIERNQCYLKTWLFYEKNYERSILEGWNNKKNIKLEKK